MLHDSAQLDNSIFFWISGHEKQVPGFPDCWFRNCLGFLAELCRQAAAVEELQLPRMASQATIIPPAADVYSQAALSQIIAAAVQQANAQSVVFANICLNVFEYTSQNPKKRALQHGSEKFNCLING